MSQPPFIAQVEAQINTRVKSSRPLHGGMIGQVHRLDLADGRRVVVKVGPSTGGTLDLEGYMLKYLTEHSHLPVPEVFYASAALLVMDYVEGDSHFDAGTQQHAADLVADLHNVTQPHFGLERDSLIAALPQPNPPSELWIDFFREQRLLYMARVAYDAGPLPADLLSRVETLAARLERWLLEPEQPSLIHGDLWTTNILAQHGRITAFLDPAIYYAHAEIELAFSTLFGTFGSAFFERYQQHRPIAPGFFEERRDLYNLYPLLVHVRLFGGGYVNSVRATLSRFGC